ncbi:putative protein TPRXL isoform X4 [Haliotis rufescens]|uniref:putative protein TPRXL isoform X4 n=1 Tax=Haliotis rufescens TaxID=6454 RepID=UPI00201F9F18|nr:putative protein TPRXL isoform X4 [Haliotis rufescens]
MVYMKGVMNKLMLTLCVGLVSSKNSADPTTRAIQQHFPLTSGSCTATVPTSSSAVTVSSTPSPDPRTSSEGSATSSINAVTSLSPTTSDISAVITPSSTTPDDQSTTVCICESSAGAQTSVPISSCPVSSSSDTGDGACTSAAAMAGTVVVTIVLTALVTSGVTYHVIRRKHPDKPDKSAPTGGGANTTLPEGTNSPDTAELKCGEEHAPVDTCTDVAVERGRYVTMPDVDCRLQIYDSETRKTNLGDDISVIDLTPPVRPIYAYNPLTMGGERMDESIQSEL